MVSEELVNPKVNIRVLLAVFWICHFILWIFGDMFSLLQEMGEPATDSLVLFVAPTTAILLTLMVVFNLVGPPTYVRLANLIVAPVYLLLNIVFFIDATQGWEYYLGGLLHTVQRPGHLAFVYVAQGRAGLGVNPTKPHIAKPPALASPPGGEH